MKVKANNDMEDFFNDCFETPEEERFDLSQIHIKNGYVSIEEIKEFLKTKKTKNIEEKFWVFQN